MSRVDCNLMSHAWCETAAATDPERTDVSSERAAAKPATRSERDGSAEADVLPSYECLNDCIASQGVLALVAGVLTGGACLLASGGACGAVIGASAGVMFEACREACDELESKP